MEGEQMWSGMEYAENVEWANCPKVANFKLENLIERLRECSKVHVYLTSFQANSQVNYVQKPYSFAPNKFIFLH